jgi:hypothetical protein
MSPDFFGISSLIIALGSFIGLAISIYAFRDHLFDILAIEIKSKTRLELEIASLTPSEADEMLPAGTVYILGELVPPAQTCNERLQANLSIVNTVVQKTQKSLKFWNPLVCRGIWIAYLIFISYYIASIPISR